MTLTDNEMIEPGEIFFVPKCCHIGYTTDGDVTVQFDDHVPILLPYQIAIKIGDNLKVAAQGAIDDYVPPKPAEAH